MHVLVLERQPAAEHDMQYDAARPNVDLVAGVEPAANDLGRGVVRGATRGAEHVVLPLPDGHAEVSHLDVAVAVEEKVLRLKVAVGDVETVAVVDGGDDLLKVAEGFGGGQAALLTEVLEELPAFDVLEDEVKFGGRLPHVVEAHDVGVFDELHDDDLALDSVEDALRLFAETSEGHARVEEGGLGDDLHRGVLTSPGVSSQSNATYDGGI